MSPTGATSSITTTTDLTEPLIESSIVTTTASSSSSTTMLSLQFGIAVSITALPMLLFGFNTGVMNAPESVIFPGHSVASWSLAVSAFCVGGFLGSSNAGRCADLYGRRSGILAIFAASFVFGWLHVLAPNMTILILARVGVGLAGGASTCYTPLMLSEIAPSEIRGSIGTLTQLSCVLGILFSVLYAIPFCKENLWRWIFVPLPLTSFLGLILGYYYLPESPKWLLLHHYETRGEEARDIVRSFRKHHSQVEEAVEMEIMLMTNSVTNAALTEPQSPEVTDTPTSTETTPTISNTNTSFLKFAKDPRNKIPLVSAIWFPIAQQLSGINAVFYYSTMLFKGVISDPKAGTILAFAVNAVATLLALSLMDRLGRKTLLAASAGGMAFCCILMTLSLLHILPPLMTVASVLLYISFFELGLGCIPFFIASEMIEPQFLGTVQSISMASNWGSNFCVGLLFPYMAKYLGAFSFVPFGLVLLATLLYALWVLPETRGKSLEMVLQEVRERGDSLQLLAQGEDDLALAEEEEEAATLPPTETTTLNEVV